MGEDSQKIGKKWCYIIGMAIMSVGVMVFSFLGKQSARQRDGGDGPSRHRLVDPLRHAPFVAALMSSSMMRSPMATSAAKGCSPACGHFPARSAKHLRWR